MGDGVHRFSGYGGQIDSVRALLIKIDLLQCQDVGPQPSDAHPQPSRVDDVTDGSAVQDVEGRDTQGDHLSLGAVRL